MNGLRNLGEEIPIPLDVFGVVGVLWGVRHGNPSVSSLLRFYSLLLIVHLYLVFYSYFYRKWFLGALFFHSLSFLLVLSVVIFEIDVIKFDVLVWPFDLRVVDELVFEFGLREGRSGTPVGIQVTTDFSGLPYPALPYPYCDCYIDERFCVYP